MKDRIFITPYNDLEAKTIKELLEDQEEQFIVTYQGWGASWGNLETEAIKKLQEFGFVFDEGTLNNLLQLDGEINKLSEELGKEQWGSDSFKEIQTALNEKKQKRNQTVHEILADISKQAKDKDIKIYGIELAEDSEGLDIIDHHGERSSLKSSIEQVADVLGIGLTIDERFVAENDKAFIPGMERLGKEFGIEEDNLREIIANIRMRDRQMQGITPEMEAQALDSIEKLGDLKGKRNISMTLPHSKTATVTDRLYGQYDNLLILCGDGETNFFGQSRIIRMLEEKFRKNDEQGNATNCWKGGETVNEENGNGFWGGYVDQEEIRKEVEEMYKNIEQEKRGPQTPTKSNGFTQVD